MDASLPVTRRFWPLDWATAPAQERRASPCLSQPQDVAAAAERDLVLVRQALEGSPTAREDLGLRLACVPAMLRALLRRAGWRTEGHDVEDLTQDVLATVWRRLPDYDGRTPFEMWVFGFCKNRALKWRERGRGRFAARGGEEDELSSLRAPEPRGQPEELDLERLRRAVAGLPRPMAEVVELKHYDELTFDQLADRLRCSPNTAKTRYYRALGLLSQALRSLASDT